MNSRLSLARVAIATVTSASVLFAGGCSAFQPKLQIVTINSYPHGAMINVDGNDVGNAPVTIQLQRNQRHTVLATLNGQAVTQRLNPHVSTTGILDIIGGVLFLVPAIGIATPGFWTVSDLTPTLILPSATAKTGSNGTSVATPPVVTVTPQPQPVKSAPAAKPAPAPNPTGTAKPAEASHDSSDPRFRPAPRIKVYDD